MTPQGRTRGKEKQSLQRRTNYKQVYLKNHDVNSQSSSCGSCKGKVCMRCDITQLHLSGRFSGGEILHLTITMISSALEYQITAFMLYPSGHYLPETYS